ncbi:MAG: hypothetical protein FWC42_02875 [Proteobacteria bacterium]|nr:hypothetical protein [Pseudomonadota bacterium]
MQLFLWKRRKKLQKIGVEREQKKGRREKYRVGAVGGGLLENVSGYDGATVTRWRLLR